MAGQAQSTRLTHCIQGMPVKLAPASSIGDKPARLAPFKKRQQFQDIDALAQGEARYARLLATMENQFRQLDQLGLMKFTRSQPGIG